MKKEDKIQNLMKKIENLKKSDMVDLSSKEDLGIAVMNLVSLEEHLFFTYEKTKDEKTLELLNEVREMRKKYMAEIVKNPKGEVWCISKHLLSAAMRFMEVGTKMLNDGKKEKAGELFDKSYGLWNIFWGLNLDFINIKDVQKEDNAEINLGKGKKASVFNSLDKVLKKVLDCCRE